MAHPNEAAAFAAVEASALLLSVTGEREIKISLFHSF